MKIDSFEVKADYLRDTKDCYVFKCERKLEKFFPPNFYLDKELFDGNPPQEIVIKFSIRTSEKLIPVTPMFGKKKKK